jgi:hypothetical protein
MIRDGVLGKVAGPVFSIISTDLTETCSLALIELTLFTCDILLHGVAP